MLFVESCGDLASLLMIKQEAWPPEELVNHTLFVLMKKSFDSLDVESIQESPFYYELLTLLNRITSYDGEKFDSRPLVALFHRVAIKMCESILNQKINVHRDLQNIWIKFGVQ
jgi:hypothetical protein